MKDHDFEVIPPSHPRTLPPSRPSAAFLWDESFLWGLMAYKALRACGLSFELIRSNDVRDGRLKDFSLLFVPGGWASNKLKALGEDGVGEIKRFVHDGGAYLGFCGGAGLATLDGIGLIRVKRRPTRERVPSFSGRIGLRISGHPLWERITDPVFHAWWPSQFVVENGDAAILASYGEALPDSFSSDVNVGDAEAVKKWPDIERVYGINLDPKRLQGEPAVIEGAFGKGKVVLSLVHFDTPGDANGAAVLKNLWKYLIPTGECGIPPIGSFEGRLHAEFGIKSPHTPLWRRGAEGGFDKGMQGGISGLQNKQAPGSEIIIELETAAAGLIALGSRNFLWYWRNPMLLQWRRGVRGLEYCTLSVMLNELVEALRNGATSCSSSDLGLIRELLLPFAEKAKRLLLLERHAMQNGHITYEKCDDPEIQSIREELFSRSKSYGGLFKRLIDEIDGSLFKVLTKARPE